MGVNSFKMSFRSQIELPLQTYGASPVDSTTSRSWLMRKHVFSCITVDRLGCVSVVDFSHIAHVKCCVTKMASAFRESQTQNLCLMCFVLCKLTRLICSETMQTEAELEFQLISENGDLRQLII